MKSGGTMEFIGREEESFILEREYGERSSLVIIYGRRRVGKTALIDNFLRDKTNSMYFFSHRRIRRFEFGKVLFLRIGTSGDTGCQVSGLGVRSRRSHQVWEDGHSHRRIPVSGTVRSRDPFHIPARMGYDTFEKGRHAHPMWFVHRYDGEIYFELLESPVWEEDGISEAGSFDVL